VRRRAGRRLNGYSDAINARQSLADLWIWAISRKRLYPFWSFMHELSLHGMGIQNYRRSVTGEIHFLQWLSRASLRRSRPYWVIDIGANIGDYVESVRYAMPDAHIICFEANPSTAARLRTRGDELRFDTVAMAVTRAPGHVVLYDYTDVPEGSEHATLHGDGLTRLTGRQSTPVSVPATTVDDVLAQRGLDHVLLVKVDTEGHELAVLEGAAHSLQRGAIDVVQLEFNEMHAFSRTFFHDLLDRLTGYQLFRMLPRDLVPLVYSPRKSEIFAFQNIVAIRTEVVGELGLK
jgi:FkbM family methyltransferase